MFGFWQSAQLRILKIQQRLEPTLNHAKKGKYKIGMERDLIFRLLKFMWFLGTFYNKEKEKIV